MKKSLVVLSILSAISASAQTTREAEAQFRLDTYTTEDLNRTVHNMPYSDFLQGIVVREQYGDIEGVQIIYTGGEMTITQVCEGLTFGNWCVNFQASAAGVPTATALAVVDRYLRSENNIPVSGTAPTPVDVIVEPIESPIGVDPIDVVIDPIESPIGVDPIDVVIDPIESPIGVDPIDVVIDPIESPIGVDPIDVVIDPIESPIGVDPIDVVIDPIESPIGVDPITPPVRIGPNPKLLHVAEQVKEKVQDVRASHDLDVKVAAVNDLFNRAGLNAQIVPSKMIIGGFELEYTDVNGDTKKVMLNKNTAKQVKAELEKDIKGDAGKARREARRAERKEAGIDRGNRENRQRGSLHDRARDAGFNGDRARQAAENRRDR